MRLVDILKKGYMEAVVSTGDAFLEGWPSEKDLLDSLNEKELKEWMTDMDFDGDYLEGVDKDVLDRFVDDILDYCKKEI